MPTHNRTARGRGPTVCHVSTVHATFDTRIFHKECGCLVEAGYDVHLVIQADRDQTVGGVRVHALPAAGGRAERILAWPLRAYRTVLRMRPRPAIVHFHDPELLPVGWLLRLGGYQVIYDVHENVALHMLAKPYIPRWAKRAVSRAYRLAERLLAPGMASVHVLDSIAASYRQPKAVVRNFPQLSAVVERAEPRPGKRPRLIFVGTNCVDSGALTMIRVAGELKRRGVDFDMRIIGPFESADLRPRMEREAVERGVTDRVAIPGRLPYEQARRELAQADLGLCLFAPIPNNLNSLPNKILEYMGTGLPVVASDFACWRPFVAGTGGGLQVDPTDPSVVADGIERLLADPAGMRRMGERGRSAVRTDYCWERERYRLLEFYEYLLERRARADRAG